MYYNNNSFKSIKTPTYKVKVSIIIPNYNHFNFLEERLQCIFNQSFTDFEMIILDDYSTDNSVSVLNQYTSHPKVKHCIFNSLNSGSTFIQWKKGLELAKGEFIWIAESDDFSNFDFLKEMVALLEEHEHAGLAYCQSYIVDENSNILRQNFEWTDDLDTSRWGAEYVNNGIAEISNYLSKKCTIPNASAVLIRKSAINLEDIRIDFKKMGDWYLWISILKKYDVVYTPKPLNYFRETTYSTRVLDTLPKLINYYEEKIEILYYLNTILNSNKTHVQEEIVKMITEYVDVNTIKNILRSNLYRKKIFFNDFLLIHSLIIKKLDFKKIMFRYLLIK